MSSSIMSSILVMFTSLCLSVCMRDPYIHSVLISNFLSLIFEQLLKIGMHLLACPCVLLHVKVVRDKETVNETFTA